MFLRAAVILFTGGCIPACTGADNPWADTPEQTPPYNANTMAEAPWQTPPSDTPLGRHPLPCACWDTHPPAQCI